MGFKTRSMLCSFACTTLAASAGADVIELEIGEFRFLGSQHAFQYTGEYGDYVGSTLAGENPTTVGRYRSVSWRAISTSAPSPGSESPVRIPRPHR